MRLVTEDWPTELLHLLHRLESAGREAVLVGGSVRDLLLRRPVHDWDVATSAMPEEVQDIFERSVPTGIKHGTITVLEGKMAFEVTTYRTEGQYTDGRRPDFVRYTDNLTADLLRRDFTVNAIAARADGTLIDPLDGLIDIERHQIRAVGAPLERFSEDALRILRGLRLAAELNFHIEANTRAAMAAASPLLHCIALERIGAETAKLLAAGDTDVYKLLASGPWLGQFPNPWSTAANAIMRCPDIKTQMDKMDSVAGSDRAYLLVAAVVAAVAWQARWDEAALRQAIRSMRWSNQVKRVSLRLLKLLTSGMENWRTTEWQLHLLDDGPVCVETACRIHDAVNESDRLVQRFTEERARQNIQSPSDLAITGTELVRLGAAGAEVGVLKARIIERVLSGTLKNEPQCLIRFATDELQRMKREAGR